jgi:hypothetical protein
MIVVLLTVAHRDRLVRAEEQLLLFLSLSMVAGWRSRQHVALMMAMPRGVLRFDVGYEFGLRRLVHVAVLTARTNAYITA